MARPNKLTPSIRERLAEGLARGLTVTATAAHAGVSIDTVERWVARAARADFVHRAGKRVPEREKPFLELHQAIAAAEADAEMQALHSIMNYVKVGALDLNQAAHAAGVSLKMLERIHNRATQVANRRDDGDRLDEDDFDYLELFDGFLQASASFEITAIGAIRRDMLNDWRAAAWYLERSNPERWAAPNKRRGNERPNAGRPIGATSAPDRPSTGDEPPPRIRLREVR